MMGMNTLRTNVRNPRRLARWTAAGAVVAALLLPGCNAEGPQKKPLLPFTKNARDESIRKQAHSDSFPTAQQAGL
jgi:hypothetical protein